MIARSPANVKSSAALDMQIWRPDRIFSKREIGAMIGWLNKYMGGDESRRLALAWLFDFLGKPLPDGKLQTDLHSAQMEDKHWYAVWHWIGSYKDENGEWLCRPEFPLEASMVLSEAMKEYQRLRANTQENRAWVDDMAAQAVGQLGGVITNVLQDDSWLPHENVEMPKTEPPKPIKKWTNDVEL